MAYVAVAQLLFFNEVFEVEIGAIQKLNFLSICVTYVYDLEGNVFCTVIMTVLGRA